MTVAAVGLDIVDVPGFAQQLEDAASAFAAHTFTPAERATAAGDPRRLAARFAAKEAFVKAWSSSRTGHEPALDTVDLREIEVVNDPAGRPRIVLHGEVERAFGDGRTVSLSLSHDGPTAAAVVLVQ